MQSEDGAFYYHHGFLPDALREALIYDLQVKRFARGGSTITMQLVKNVFLNKNKKLCPQTGRSIDCMDHRNKETDFERTDV